MNAKISHTASARKFLDEASGLHNDGGDPRVKALISRILRDSVNIIEDLAVTPEEFWKAVNYLNVLGSRQEAGLLVAGLGLEHYLDLLMDAEDEQAGKSGGTPRTIEGPLYVAGAPLSNFEARLDDGVDPGVQLFMQGQVKNTAGEPLPVRWSMCGMPTRAAPIPISMPVSRSSTCVGESSPMPKAATVFAASCRQAMAARRTVRPSNCSINWAVTGSARRISTSLFLLRIIVTSRPRSTSMATSTCMTTLPTPHAMN